MIPRACGIVNIGCHFHKLIDPVWFWLQLGLWVAIALVVLWVLARIKTLFGWQGVLAALVALGGVIIAIFSFRAGRQSVLQPEGDYDAPVRPPKKPRKPSTPADNRPGTWNAREGKWNE